MIVWHSDQNIEYRVMEVTPEEFKEIVRSLPDCTGPWPMFFTETEKQLKVWPLPTTAGELWKVG
jgi:hypothetical protein